MRDGKDEGWEGREYKGWEGGSTPILPFLDGWMDGIHPHPFHPFMDGPSIHGWIWMVIDGWMDGWMDG